jgi:23S rRNA pseudouridine1911/1915/1917 synthase
MTEIPVVFEDDYLVVINKPAGMVCNRAESVKEPTLQDWMESTDRVGEADGDLGREYLSRSGLVHRLDKETSGVLVLAKNPEFFNQLKSQFKQRKTRKLYKALVHGKFEPQKGDINLPMRRNILNRRKFVVDVNGKMGRTGYEVEKYFLPKNLASEGSTFAKTLTLLSLAPRTGRTHQLRVHLSHLGYPIVSDPLYLGKRLSADLRWCPRLFLHAFKLGFEHPVRGEWVEFEAELARDLQMTLEELEETSGNLVGC